MNREQRIRIRDMEIESMVMLICTRSKFVARLRKLDDTTEYGSTLLPIEFHGVVGEQGAVLTEVFDVCAGKRSPMGDSWVRPVSPTDVWSALGVNPKNPYPEVASINCQRTTTGEVVLGSSVAPESRAKTSGRTIFLEASEVQPDILQKHIDDLMSDFILD